MPASPILASDGSLSFLRGLAPTAGEGYEGPAVSLGFPDVIHGPVQAGRYTEVSSSTRFAAEANAKLERNVLGAKSRKDSAAALV